VSARRHQARKLKDWRDAIWTCPRLTRDPEAKSIAIAIQDKVDWDTFSTVISNPTLAHITSYGERTVSYRVQKLIGLGFLSGRPRGSGRTWALRELTLLWPARAAGHESTRPAPDAGHETARPAQDDSMARTERSHDLHRALPTNLETNTETKGAASPSPANAVSAALPEKPAFVLSLSGKGFKPDEIAKYGKHRFDLTIEQVNRIIGSRALTVETDHDG
jgi:hypothetical protein